MKTRREFRKSLGSRNLGSRNARREGTKVKRLGSGKLSEPVRERYAVKVKRWLKEQTRDQ
jgi:hypothetical protein